MKKFTKFNKIDLANNHKGSVFLGKIYNEFNVYICVFELYDKKAQEGWTLTVYYDLSRGILLDAITSEISDKILKVKKRNSSKGDIFNGDINNVSGEQCESCEKKTNVKSSALAESMTSIFFDDTAAAYHDTPDLPDSSCKWVSTVTCILWFFLNVIGGVVCTLVMTLSCP